MAGPQSAPWFRGRGRGRTRRRVPMHYPARVGVAATKTFLAAVRGALPDGAVDATAATRSHYAHNRLPLGDRPPVAVIFPESTEAVREVVRLANAHRIPLYPISTGENSGLGLRSPSSTACAVVDLGRMNRILEIDETLCFAEIEPGVSYRDLYLELGRRGHQLMLDTTSGPPGGGVVGNTLDKGAGYTPYFDHFGMSCGLEVVLGDGQLLRTADGALAGTRTWHLNKYGYGPVLDGLFVQSNFGIVTRLGLWLMPRPPALRTFFFHFPEDGDLGEIMERVRPLKLSNAVPSLIKVTSDLYGLGTATSYPFERAGGVTPLPDALRRELRAERSLGAWCVSGAFYGSSDAALDPMIERVRGHFEASGRARYVSHEEALEDPAHRIHIDTFSGRPTESELGLLEWRPGGGAIWFLPATPVVGEIANRHQALSRRILREHGFEYVVEFVCGPRISRALHLILFDRSDPAEVSRVLACYRALANAYAEAGYPVSRAPLDFQREAMDRLDTVPAVCGAIKRALDPNGILAPGRYGIP